MERKGRISGWILGLLASVLTVSCNEKEAVEGTEQKVVIRVLCEGYRTRSTGSIDDLITDINIIAFDGKDAEISEWIQTDGMEEISLSLVRGRKYTIFAGANIGRRLDIKTLEELDEASIEIVEGKKFENGLPMSAIIKDVDPETDTSIELELRRMAAKISLRLDRSRLSEDVKMEVEAVRIGNYPKYMKLYGTNRIESIYDRYDTGFEYGAEECSLLNTIGRKGISSEISMYLPENMQGEFPYEISSDEEKVLEDDDPLFNTCSYMEIELGYRSTGLVSHDRNLIYRFYLGDGIDNLDVEGNCHYHITIVPEDDGLSGGGWRVDKSGLGPSDPFLTLHPGSYIEGKVGDKIHVWCEFYPTTAEFDIGKEELEYDRKRGIYDYTVDSDGHGVTLDLKKPGTGIVYMSAGEPINRSEMAIIVVKP